MFDLRSQSIAGVMPLKWRTAAALTATMLGLVSSARGQTLSPTSIPTAVATSQVLDAAGPEQRAAINSIFLIECVVPGEPGSAGSGFLLDTGIMVTNSHVVGPCTEDNLIAISASNQKVHFSKVIKDEDRDLALLVPYQNLGKGLHIAESENPKPGTTVSTWGYPFLYNGTSPLLSVGYVAGFKDWHSPGGKDVSHIVVNGAFNHGNSGGPLLVSNDTNVIGVVVMTYNFFTPDVKQIIEVMSAQQSGFMYTETQPNGKTNSYSEAQIVARVLEQFYEKTQVMIGEAIAASELKAMLLEHAKDLSH